MFFHFILLIESEQKMLIPRKLQDQKGAALVEFTIATPLLLLLLCGFIEFGVLLYNKQVITNASREGARAAINTVPLLSSSEVVAVVTNYCGQKLISFNTSNPIAVTPPNENRAFGEEVNITVTWDYNFLLPSILNLGPTITLSSQTRMKMM